MSREILLPAEQLAKSPLPGTETLNPQSRLALEQALVRDWNKQVGVFDSVSVDLGNGAAIEGAVVGVASIDTETGLACVPIKASDNSVQSYAVSRVTVLQSMAELLGSNGGDPASRIGPLAGLRPVMVTSIRAKASGIGNERYEKGRALFHAWGMASEDNGESYGPYSTAIVEFPDGTVENVYVENIRFLDRT